MEHGAGAAGCLAHRLGIADIGDPRRDALAMAPL
jgi:hypothetical protein